MRNLLVLTLLATLSLWAAENTLPDELLEKYYQTETIVTKDGELLDKITISGPPTPPPGFERPTVSGIELAKTDGVGMISTGELDFNQSSASRMPAYNWSFGCTATTAAMMAAWYDRNGYPNVYTGPTGGGLAPLNNSMYPDVVINGERRHQTPLSATHKGLDGRKTRGHVDDYWVKYGSTNTDPYYRHWTEHTYSSCTGDYMKTNQWYHDQKNSDGSTTIYNWTSSGKPLTAADMESLNIHTKDGPYGLKLFFESRGYSVTTLYNQNIDARFSGGFSFAQYKSEIKAGRPVMIHVKGHTMEGIGWKDPNIVRLHDTWDYNVHEMTWGGSYSGMKHQSVSVLHLKEVNNPPVNNPPVANAGADKTVQVNESVTITGTGSDSDGAVVSYEWKKGNTLLAHTASFLYIPDTVGTDTLTLTVIDNEGATNSDSMTVTVTAVPNIPPQADAGTDVITWVNQAVTITGSGTDSDGTIVSYEWKKGSTVLSTNASFSYTPTTVGTDILTLTVTDDKGATGSDSMTVTVTAVPNTPPVANAGADVTTQVNQSVTIRGTGVDSDGTIVSYEWKKGNAVLSNTASFLYIPDTVGTDTLTLTVMDNDGTTGSDSMRVTVTAVPVNNPPQANAGPNRSVQVDESITITGSGTDSDGAVVSYEWKKGNTVLAHTASFLYIPDTVGTDTLTLTVTDDEGATGSDTMDVTVTEEPVPEINMVPILYLLQ